MAIVPNTQFPTKTTAPSAAYPQGGAQNITAPGDGTGTPWDQAIVNDIFGLQQWLLAQAGITPSGSADTALVSDYGDALMALFIGNVKTQTITASNPAFVPDAQTKTIEFTVIAAGGGAGATDGQGAGTAAVAEAGSAGSFTNKKSVAVAASYAIVVAAGGAGALSGSVGGSGSDGGISSVIGGDIAISANGGRGGAGDVGAAGDRALAGQLGGNAGGGNPDGRGGASTCAVRVGGVLSALSTSGGSTLGGSRPSNLASDGALGDEFGAGGGASHSQDVSGNFAGGDGGGGAVIVTEYF